MSALFTQHPPISRVNCLGAVLLVCLLCPQFTASGMGQDENPPESTEERFIGNARQVTFEGKRAGEGYFGPNGSKMVFQSERHADNPFFQIYLLDFEFGEIEPISPGFGKTTCGWIHPDGKRILFSSTQDDPQAREKQRKEIEFRESGQSRRYAWDYDEQYEIYTYDTNSKNYNRLTTEQGYDAEGSYSPDGKLIAFASNRNAYAKPMSDEQKKAFEMDPAYMMDIFIMNSDGTDVRQLTDVNGYDGGPFFSPDGKRICWRRFSENGATAEIMTMNIDGSDQRPLTKIGAMSWAPFYHPSGKYLIFTTNRHGFANFELYIVDVDGKSPPVRITTTDGFDGLASFSPDGTQLTWTSNRNEKKESQIYLADWNHTVALKALAVGDDNPAEWASAIKSGKGAAKTTNPSFDQADFIKHIDYLCREELGGRMTGSVGEKKATAYVAAYLDSLGIQAAGDNGSWYQNFEFPAGSRLGTNNRLASQRLEPDQSPATDYPLNQDWRPLSFSRNGEIEPSQIVFAGYGIVAPPAENQEEYDSYVHLDVKDKWALIFRYMPENIPAERRQHLQYHSSLRKKAMDARDKGARGIIVISGPNSNVKNELVTLQNDFANAGSSVAAISVIDDVAQKWLTTQGKDLQTLQDRLDTGEPMMGFPIKNLELDCSIDVEQVVGRGRNVVGRLLMGDTPADQAVLVGAHIDHLGRGTGGSLAKNEEREMIHVGADDNASGVAAMLEVAEYLADLKRKGKLDMKRDVIFAAWSGEELGLHGSQHFVNQLLGTDSTARTTDVPSNEPKPIPDGTNPHDITIEQISELIQQISNDLPAMNGQELKSSIVELTLLSQFMEQGIKAFDGQIEQSNNATELADWRRQRNEISDTWDQAQSTLAALKKTEESISETLDESQPAKSIYPKISAALNMDMVGRMEKQLVLQGIGSSDYWTSEIEKRNAVVGLPIKLNNDTQLPTDASSFYRAGVPILSAFTGSHSDYHTPRDTPEKLNYPDATRISKLMGLVARGLVINNDIPAYIKQAAQEKRASRGVMRAYLGTVPDYAADQPGVLLSDVTSGAPADKAGVQGGDIIVELAGRKIENIYDFTYAIEALKIGQETSIAVTRKGKRLEMKITPGSRE